MRKHRLVGAVVLAAVGAFATGSRAADRATDATAGEGEKLFGALCGGCHPEGGRKSGRGSALTATTLDAAATAELVTRGVPGKHLAFGRRLKPEEVTALVDYVQALKGR